MNAQTPYRTSPTTIQESIRLDYDDKMFEYNYIDEKPNIDPKQIQQKMEETRISTLEEQLITDPIGTRDFLSLIAKDGYGIRIRFLLQATNDTIKVEVSNHEIVGLLSTQ